MTTAIVMQAADNAGMMNLIMIVAMVAIMYFFMIRPQQKKQKEIAKFRAALKVGDEVITSGGIYGKIKEINDNIIIIEVDDRVKLKVDRSFVYGTAADSQTK